MMLNATLVVQIFHFIIAYIILDYFFLRKAVTIIQQEKSDQEIIMNNIQKERDAVTAKHEEKKDDWQKYQQKFIRATPKIIERPHFKQFEKKVPECCQPTEDEINYYVAKFQKLLMQKVTHDNQ